MAPEPREERGEDGKGQKGEPSAAVQRAKGKERAGNHSGWII